MTYFSMEEVHTITLTGHHIININRSSRHFKIRCSRQFTFNMTKSNSNSLAKLCSLYCYLASHLNKIHSSNCDQFQQHRQIRFLLCTGPGGPHMSFSSTSLPPPVFDSSSPLTPPPVPPRARHGAASSAPLAQAPPVPAPAPDPALAAAPATRPCPST